MGNADFLLDAGTRLGYAACGLKSVWQKDKVLLDANDLSLIGLPASHLVDGVIFNGTPRAVREVHVNGRPIIQNGHHADTNSIASAYTNTIRKLLDA